MLLKDCCCQILPGENLEGFKAVLPRGHPLALGFVGGEQTRAMDDLELTWGSCCSGSEGRPLRVGSVRAGHGRDRFASHFPACVFM